MHFSFAPVGANSIPGTLVRLLRNSFSVHVRIAFRGAGLVDLMTHSDVYMLQYAILVVRHSFSVHLPFADC